jgi:hypothetical protein
VDELGAQAPRDRRLPRERSLGWELSERYKLMRESALGRSGAACFSPFVGKDSSERFEVVRWGGTKKIPTHFQGQERERPIARFGVWSVIKGGGQVNQHLQTLPAEIHDGGSRYCPQAQEGSRRHIRAFLSFLLGHVSQVMTPKALATVESSYA